MNLSISRNGSEIGDWTEEDIGILYAEGQLLPTDYYWKEGMAEWKELGTLIKPSSPPPIAVPLEDNLNVLTSEPTQSRVNATDRKTDNKKLLWGMTSGLAIFMVVCLLILGIAAGAGIYLVHSRSAGQAVSSTQQDTRPQSESPVANETAAPDPLPLDLELPEEDLNQLPSDLLPDSDSDQPPKIRFLNQYSRKKDLSCGVIQLRYVSANSFSLIIDNEEMSGGLPALYGSGSLRVRTSQVPDLLAALRKFDAWVEAAKSANLLDGSQKELFKGDSGSLVFISPDELKIGDFSLVKEDVDALITMLKIDLPNIREEILVALSSVKQQTELKKNQDIIDQTRKSDNARQIDNVLK